MIKIIFNHHKVWGPNFFNHQTFWQPKFSITNPTTIENFQAPMLWQLKTFQSPLFMVIKTFRSPQKGDVSYVLKKPLTKTYDTTPFLGDQKNSITIWQWRFIRWWSIFFCHHSTHLHHRLMTEIFWSPSNGVGVLDGDQKSLVTIWRWTYVRWWLNLSVPKKESMSHVFEKPSMKAFEKRCHKPTFCGN